MKNLKETRQQVEDALGYAVSDRTTVKSAFKACERLGVMVYWGWWNETELGRQFGPR